MQCTCVCECVGWSCKRLLCSLVLRLLCPYPDGTGKLALLSWWHTNRMTSSYWPLTCVCASSRWRVTNQPLSSLALYRRPTLLYASPDLSSRDRWRHSHRQLATSSNDTQSVNENHVFFVVIIKIIIIIITEMLRILRGALNFTVCSVCFCINNFCIFVCEILNTCCFLAHKFWKQFLTK